MNNNFKLENDFKEEKKEVDINIGADGIFRVKIEPTLNEEDVEKLIKEALSLSQKNPGEIRVLVNFISAPHIPLFIFRKKTVNLIKNVLAEIKKWKIAAYGGGTIQKTVASFVANASGLENIRFFNSEADALKWLKEKTQK